EHLSRLGRDVVRDQRAARVEDIAGNLVAAGCARTDAREEQQIADAARVRIRADRRGRGIGRGAVVHRLWHGLIPRVDCPATPWLQVWEVDGSCGKLVRDSLGALTVITWLPIRWPRSSVIVSR